MTIAHSPTSRPPLGISARVKVVEVIDGDTIEVEIVRKLRVRLSDCWAPESRSSDPAERRIGTRSKDHLTGLAKLRSGVLFIPTDHADRIGDVMTFDRVVGSVWLDGEAQSLSEIQVGARKASTVKGGKLGA